MIDLDGVVMHVSATAANGVVDSSTLLRFRQRGGRVWATYGGGRVRRGWLVGRFADDRLRFRYAQSEVDGSIHGGRSQCEVRRMETGLVRIVEHFAWSTRTGHGINVFDELVL